MQKLAKLVIRPSREKYTHLELGPNDFIVSGKVYSRADFELVNARGLTLKCSWFKAKFSTGQLPCIVYCHGNCGSRKDALDLAKTMLPLGYTVFAFDFAGSGMSEGEYVSLGYYESWDLKTVTAHLKAAREVSSVVLWGRSMGAVSAILYASCDPAIALLVLDSPFASLKTVMKEFIEPKVMLKSVSEYLLRRLREHLVKLAKFDIEDVCPAVYLPGCRMPAVFMHGINDTLVNISHSRELFKDYRGDKYLLELGGGHNSGRPPHILEKIHAILTEMLSLPYRPEEHPLDTVKVRPTDLKLTQP